MDLLNLQFLDSTGLRFFFKLQKHLKNNSSKLFLIKPNAVVRQLFEITELTDLFNIDKTLKT